MSCARTAGRCAGGVRTKDTRTGSRRGYINSTCDTLRPPYTFVISEEKSFVLTIVANGWPTFTKAGQVNWSAGRSPELVAPQGWFFPVKKIACIQSIIAQELIGRTVKRVRPRAG